MAGSGSSWFSMLRVWGEPHRGKDVKIRHVNFQEQARGCGAALCSLPHGGGDCAP